MRLLSPDNQTLPPALVNLGRTLISHKSPWFYKRAENQDISKYTLLAEHLSTYVGKYEFSEIFDARVFDEALKRARSKTLQISVARTIFWLSFSFSLILLMLTYVSGNLLMATAAIACILVCSIAGIFLTNETMRKYGPTASQIISSAREPRRAELIVHALENDVAGKYDFYIVDPTGTLQQLPNKLYRADNALIFLLGQPHHRHAVPYSGSPPQQELYISKSKTTKDIRTPTAIINFLSNRDRIRDLLSIVRKLHPYDPGAPNRKLTRHRERWVKALRVISENWDEWQNLQSRIGSNSRLQDELIECLRIRKKSNSEMGVLFNDFISGQNRNFGNWLINIGFIDEQTRALSLKYRDKS